MSIHVSVKLSAVAAFELQPALAVAVEYMGVEVEEWWQIADATTLDDSVPTSLSLAPSKVGDLLRLLRQYQDEYRGLHRVTAPLMKRLEAAHREVTHSEEYRSSLYDRRHRLVVRLAGLQNERSERAEKLARRERRELDAALGNGRQVSSAYVDRTVEIRREVTRLDERIQRTLDELKQDTVRRCEGSARPLAQDLAEHLQALLAVSYAGKADVEDEKLTRHALAALGVPYVAFNRGWHRSDALPCDSCGDSLPGVEVLVTRLSGERAGECDYLSLCSDCASTL